MSEYLDNLITVASVCAFLITVFAPVLSAFISVMLIIDGGKLRLAIGLLVFAFLVAGLIPIAHGLLPCGLQ